ncbi:MAG: Uma2 family endonuclease [Panacibacter sp.]
MEIKEPAVKYITKQMMTVEEYLAWEPLQQEKYEYDNGEVVAMSGASLPHNYIHSNLIIAIGKHLEGKPCDVFASDLRVQAKAEETYYYPGITIVCDEPELTGEKVDIISNPTVIIEILSPSTEQRDRNKKKFFYMQMPTLKEYIMIDSVSFAADILRKTEDNKWQNEILIEKESLLQINSIGFTIPLISVYRKVIL